MADRRDGEGSAAIRYCQDNYQWLLDKCRHAMKVRRFPNYTDEGQDLAQTVCQVCGMIPEQKWSEIEDREAYISAMIRNAANRAYRVKTGSPVIDIEDLGTLPDRPHFKALDAAILLRELLNLLPEDRRTLIEMADVEKLSGKEIAALLDLTPATIRQRLSRARRELKDLLSGTDASPPG
ncbi:MAG TPA: sigma-70 family RNA polymerase sigma factor [Pyrinomonadaceae bacterium]|jgi:RNA polymerase sigma-70 factor (ECF subfamily)|nr:sigma-70 family RNA polymerase sigma factor [Pyrinomonadaceae bacterium]